MGRSEEKTDFWGKTYTVHYDDNGKEVGQTKTHEPDFFESLFKGTEPYEKRYDADGNYSGKTETHEPEFFESLFNGTEPYEKHYDADGRYSGKTQTHEPNFFESLARGSTRPYQERIRVVEIADHSRKPPGSGSASICRIPRDCRRAF